MTAGPAMFVAVAFVATWASSALLGSVELPGLVGATVLYVAMVGWPPLVALSLAETFDDDALDRGARTASLRFLGIGIGATLALIAGAAVLDSAVLATARHREPIGTGAQALGIAAGFAATLVLVWLQALVEEIAWRGYLLPHLVRAYGAWTGLVVHGLLWGICYAPVFVFAGAFEHAAGAIVTCTLAGTLLGWLRFASGSVHASAAANATLTLCAGLPLALRGGTSPASAIVEPVGWLLMLLVIAGLATRARLRRAIAPPLPDHVN